MTAAVVVMSASATSTVPKRHGFSIESLIGTPEPSPAAATTPPRPHPIRPILSLEVIKEERQKDKDGGELDTQTEKDIHDLREREIGMLREREIGMLRERGLIMEKEFREMKDREIAREKEIRDIREGRSSNPLFQRLSPCSNSPTSPRVEKSLTPQLENRLWPGEDFKHILGNFHANQLDSNVLYQPLRVCNRALASIGAIPGVGPSPPTALGVGMPHFSHIPINPLLYNVPRELSHQTHPLLAARYSGFIHPRYQMGPPPGLLFHPYRKPKRNRTAFSPSQLLQLEQAFEKNHYVVGQERKSLAAKLQLTETQVKVWFQNRRTKHKRMKAEEDGGSSGSQVEGQDGDAEKRVDVNDLTVYADHEEDEDPCSDDDEEVEELSVTEDC